jgi:hypothetical protein
MALIEKRNNCSVELTQKFREVDNTGIHDFEKYDKPFEMGLWVLWVAKEKLGIKRLRACDIANVIVDVKETSIKSKTIVNSFNATSRGKGAAKIHIHNTGEEIYYEIMKEGKDHLLAQAGSGSVKVYYFEPEKRYSSKRILGECVFNDLGGELKIVDPYCDSGTLDILSNSKNKIKFLTQIENLRTNVKQRFLRDLKDFKSEYPNIDFRSYSKSGIHDRYIISDYKLVILGYSLKDLGARESFSIILDKKTSGDIFNMLVENFNRRWKVAAQL